MRYHTPQALTDEVEAQMRDRAATIGARVEEAARALAAEWGEYAALFAEARRYRAEGVVSDACRLTAPVLGAVSVLPGALTRMDQERHRAANPPPPPPRYPYPMTAQKLRQLNDAGLAWGYEKRPAGTGWGR
jgi:hypothetical protein